MFRNYNRNRSRQGYKDDPLIKTLLAILRILIVCLAITLIILFIKIMGDPNKEIDDIIGLAFGSICLVLLVIANSISGSDPYE